jgi:hypothetical protein
LKLKNKITAEEIGREILKYPGQSMARGITYGAIWGALVRVASIYRRADAAFEARKPIGISVASAPRAESRYCEQPGGAAPIYNTTTVMLCCMVH